MTNYNELRDGQEFYANGYKKGYEDAKKEYARPQGEWRFTTHYARRYRVCPFCGSEKEDDRASGWYFCWHCGAHVKGEAE